MALRDCLHWETRLLVSVPEAVNTVSKPIATVNDPTCYFKGCPEKTFALRTVPLVVACVSFVSDVEPALDDGGDTQALETGFRSLSRVTRRCSLDRAQTP